MSGLTLLNKIREFSPSVPVVMITAHGTVNGAVDMMRQGATDYITKPFSPARLYETIEKLMACLDQLRAEGISYRELCPSHKELEEVLSEAVDGVA